MSKPNLRWIICVFCASFVLSIFTCHAYAIQTSASAALLMDADSGRVLYAQSPHTRHKIASTTKIMTALVAIENGRLSNKVTVSKSATLAEGSSMYLKPGQQLTLETLLYGLMLCSGNDAALAVAEAVGGNVPDFVTMMNEKAVALGMTDTSFANPNGLDDPAHYSTAYDMAKLACAAIKNETLLRIVSTRQITIRGQTLTNHNKLLSHMDNCLGLKTGYTKAAGRTLVTCAVQDNRRLVAVTLCDGDDWDDHEALYRYGFSTYSYDVATEAGKVVGVLPVRGGKTGTVPVVTADGFIWPVAEGEQLTTSIQIHTPVSAPLKAGQQAGELYVYLDGEEIGKVPLVYGRDIVKADELQQSPFVRLRELLTQNTGRSNS